MNALDPDFVNRHDPYGPLPRVPSFPISSDDLTDGAPLPLAQASGLFGVDGGADRSPHLRWSELPVGTRSIAVTAFDPDAPTASGFWHWAVAHLPPDLRELPAGAGSEPGDLPAGAVQLRNDAGVRGYLGAAPPPGHGAHRYIFAVHALDLERLDLNAETSPALLNFLMFGHTLARAVLTSTFERPAEAS